MYVHRLELVDFRSYERVAVDLQPGANVLIGANGVGKTNLVEALGYVATLDSHRVATDAPLVRMGATSAVIRCAVVHDGRELLVELEIVPGKANRARLGRSPARRARDVLGHSGSCSSPRRTLSWCGATRPNVAATWTTCWSIDSPGTPACGPTTSGWSSSATPCCAPRTWPARPVGPGRRPRHPRRLGHPPGPARRGVARRATGAGGRAHPARRQGVRRGGRRSGRREHRVPALDRADRPDHRPGGAGRGPDRGPGRVPHRRDRTGHHPGRPAPRRVGAESRAAARQGYASHGESWSFALALRLAGYDLLRADGIEPVLVLDDVFAELDTGRRQRLAELVGGASQLLVTCAVDDDVPAALRGTRYQVGEGTVRRVG
ncbi:AAA family ATPase [Micromonospora sp. M12]